LKGCLKIYPTLRINLYPIRRKIRLRRTTGHQARMHNLRILLQENEEVDLRFSCADADIPGGFGQI